jgi:hypothetical protein
MRHELTMETGALLVSYLRRVARKMCVEPRKARQQRSTWDLEISTRLSAFGHGRPASRWKRPLAFPIEQGLFALSSSRNTGIPANQRAVVLPKQRAFSPPTRRARADSSAKN